MEREKKRKRGEVDGVGGRRREEEKEKEKEKGPAPTEDEVEEFFAILKRMHVAVKYFEKSNVGIDGRKLTEKLETEILELVDHADNVKLKEKTNGNGNGVLDLNRIPEEESSS